MSDFTDEDVTALARLMVQNMTYEEAVDHANGFCAEYRKRVREDMGLDAEQYRLGWEKGNQRGRVEALREAADAWEGASLGPGIYPEVEPWLRARADAGDPS